MWSIERSAKPNSSPWFSAACTITIAHTDFFLSLYQNNKSSESKVKFRQASNRSEKILKLQHLHMLIKLIKQESITFHKTGSWKFCISLIVLSTKIDLLYLLYSTTHRCCLLHLIKQNLLIKTFLRTLILMTQLPLYLFSFLELIWNCIILLLLPRWLKDHTEPWFNKDVWPWMVVPNNCESELSFILGELFNMYLKESCFWDCWKVLLMVPVFKDVEGRSAAKNFLPLSLLSVVRKVFEKLVNDRLVDHPKWPFF